MNNALIVWDFRRGLSGWSPGADVVNATPTPEGLKLVCRAPDSQLVSPPLDRPLGPFVTVTVTMRSRGDINGALYFGARFTEEKSRPFAVRNDGARHVYRIALPALPAGARLRLDPTAAAGEVVLESIAVDAHAAPPHEPWARPAELRGKRLIGAGQYTTSGDEAVHSRYLARHPEFVARFPFDGIIVPALVPATVAEGLGLEKRDYLLHELLWTTLALPEDALASAISDLNAVRWGHLTDNFLNVTLIDGSDGKRVPNLADDRDWTIVETHAAAAARLCRLTGLTGFWLDTEQYGNYAGTEAKFPLGKDSDAVLRQRGAQWIRAVQRELPAVKLLITFAWSPDANGYGPLKGVTPFLNGVLDGIQAPGEIHHGYENTFYYGQGPGTFNVVNDGRSEGYPGGRARFAMAHASIRAWRAFSGNPEKYDRVVKAGMAAWVEDDPWNQWNGFPSGTRWSFWSNAALALAYSDKYVWVWTEHTHYGHGLAAGNGVNPFLASLANQTRNAGDETPDTLAEDFSRDPMQGGWHFDFDMLAIGGKARPEHEVATMSLETAPYRWDAPTRAVHLRGDRLTVQRRRFVHPIRPIAPGQPFAATFDFRIDRFPSAGDPPLAVGLFAHDRRVADAIAAQIHGPTSVRLAGVPIRLTAPLAAGAPCRLTLTADRSGLRATLSQAGVWVGRLTLPARRLSPVDEAGAALWDSPSPRPPGQKSLLYQWRLEAVRLTIDRNRTRTQ